MVSKERPARELEISKAPKFVVLEPGVDLATALADLQKEFEPEDYYFLGANNFYFRQNGQLFSYEARSGETNGKCATADIPLGAVRPIVAPFNRPATAAGDQGSPPQVTPLERGESFDGASSGRGLKPPPEDLRDLAPPGLATLQRPAAATGCTPIIDGIVVIEKTCRTCCLFNSRTPEVCKMCTCGD